MYCVSIHFSVAKTLSLSHSPTLASTGSCLCMKACILFVETHCALHCKLYLTSWSALQTQHHQVMRSYIHREPLRIYPVGLCPVLCMYGWVACVNGIDVNNVNTCTVHEHTSTMFTSKIFSPSIVYFL